jgi:hypothetical protein
MIDSSKLIHIENTYTVQLVWSDVKFTNEVQLEWSDVKSKEKHYNLGKNCSTFSIYTASCFVLDGYRGSLVKSFKLLIAR